MAGEAYKFAYETLKQQISSSRYKVGMRMPAERELCSQLGVSRITLRHAMRLLQDEGLIVRYSGKGTFVTSGSPRKLPIVNHDYTGSVKSQGERIKRQVLTVEYGCLPTDVSEEVDVAGNGNWMIAERLDSLRDEPVAYDVAYIPDAFAGNINDLILARIDFLEAWLALEQIGISENTQLVEAGKAGKKLASLLNISAGEPVLCTREIIYDSRRQILGVFDTRYRSDRFKLVSNSSFDK